MNNFDVEFAKDIPERFCKTALEKCKNFVLSEWKRVVGLRGKFYSFRLDDCYRILTDIRNMCAYVCHHDKYLRKIANLKKRGF
jgi:hypothetical protein